LSNSFEILDIEDGDIVDLNLMANRFLSTTTMGNWDKGYNTVAAKRLCFIQAHIRRHTELGRSKSCQTWKNLMNIPKALPKVKTDRIIDEKKANDLLKMLAIWNRSTANSTHNYVANNKNTQI